MASSSFSGGGASNRSEYDAMSSSDIPENGSVGSVDNSGLIVGSEGSVRVNVEDGGGSSCLEAIVDSNMDGSAGDADSETALGAG